ncbi:MAG: DUF2490 domain-containing protein [Bacteroidota bacterium]|nr:DUF2490 domain-containing protein [Bacteroidota bacterium]
MRYRIKIIIIIIAISNVLIAQENHYSGLFPTINISGNIYKKFDYSLYVFNAFNFYHISKEKINSETQNTFFINYIEFALSYRFNKYFSTSGAYVYERQNPVYPGFRNENRYHLQINANILISDKFSIKQRLRFDIRFIRNNNADITPLTHRIRYLAGFNHQLSSKNYISGYNELFLSTSTPTDAIYSENWASIALGMKTKRLGDFEIGPLYITWITNAQKERLHLWYLQLLWAFPIHLFNNTQPIE